MPEPINLRLEFDPRDHQTLRLAAALQDSPNLRAWATRTLLDAARKIQQANLKAQAEGPGDDLCNPSY